MAYDNLASDPNTLLVATDTLYNPSAEAAWIRELTAQGFSSTDTLWYGLIMEHTDSDYYYESGTFDTRYYNMDSFVPDATWDKDNDTVETDYAPCVNMDVGGI